MGDDENGRWRRRRRQAHVLTDQFMRHSLQDMVQTLVVRESGLADDDAPTGRGQTRVIVQIDEEAGRREELGWLQWERPFGWLVQGQVDAKGRTFASLETFEHCIGRLHATHGR